MKDQKLGKSVPIIVKGSDILTRNDDGSYIATSTSTAKQFWDFCTEEKFSGQIILSKGKGFCTGVLLSNPPIISTTAHCYDREAEELLLFYFLLLKHKLSLIKILYISLIV